MYRYSAPEVAPPSVPSGTSAQGGGRNPRSQTSRFATLSDFNASIGEEDHEDEDEDDPEKRARRTLYAGGEKSYPP
jgi:hypothetical protein